MATETENSNNKSVKAQLVRSSPTVFLGAGVLLAFGFFVAFIARQIEASDAAWTRLMYVYGSVEAIVFAAAGGIFGTHVQRRQTQEAESRAEKATDKADQKAEAAARGMALANVIRAERKTLAPGIAQLRLEDQISPTSPAAATSSVINRLAVLADELFPSKG